METGKINEDENLDNSKNTVKTDIDELFEKKPQASSKPKEIQTEIDLSEKGEVDTKATVSFKKPGFLKGMVQKQTVKSDEIKEEKKQETPTKEQFDKEIAEAEKKQEFSIDELMDISETIIDVLETVATTGLRWYAKDNTDAPYALTKVKRDRLVRQLARILYKYQAKFNLVFLFIIGLLATYATPFNKARERRKEVLSGKKPEPVTDVNHEEIATKIVKKEVVTEEIGKKEEKTENNLASLSIVAEPEKTEKVEVMVPNGQGDYIPEGLQDKPPVKIDRRRREFKGARGSK